MRTATLRLEDMKTTIINMGYVGENEHKQIRFDGKKMFQEYPNASVSLTVCPACGEAYPATIERDGDFVLWTITDSDLVAEGCGEIQLTFTESPHIAKSYICRTKVLRSLVPTGDIPSGLDDFITRADTLLEELEDAIPEGGTTGQVLAKKSNDDFDTEWVDQTGGGGTGDYTDLTNKPQIGGVTLTGNKTLHDLGAATEEAVGAKYTKPASGIPASDMADGVIPVLTDLIDDTAGDGDTDKVWSADKSADTVQSVLSEISQKQDAPETEGTSGQVLGLDGNLKPEWKTVSGGGTVDSSLSTSSTNPVENKAIAVPVNHIDTDLTQLKTNGYTKFYPTWESGDWGVSGKATDATKCRSDGTVYLPNGTYTAYTSGQLTVWAYAASSPSSGGVDLLWKQTGTKTFTVGGGKNYVAFVSEGATAPIDVYAIIPSALSDVIAQATKNSNDISADRTRIAKNTEYADGTYNAVLDNVTVTVGKGIGSGIQVGSVVTLTNDSYAQVLEAPVTAGHKYRLKARVYNNYYLAHFTDSNNFLIEKTPKNTTGGTYTFVDEVVTAPAGATKIYVSGMKNTTILFDEFNGYTIKNIDNMKTPARGAFCIMEFNVGDWYEGKYRDADSTSIIPADETIYTNYMSLFNSIFGRYKPDIALLNEDAQEMCMNRHDDSRAFLGQYYRNMYRGKNQSQTLTDVFNTIASAFPLSDVTTTFYTNTENNMTRNYVKGYTYLNGKKICVICTHLSSDWETAKLNAAELLTAITTEDPEYLILCGDFNLTPSVSEVEAFETAGYTVSYGSVTYDGHTYGPGDFIITTSNITVKSVFCDQQKIDASYVEYIDHLPTIAYLEIF